MIRYGNDTDASLKGYKVDCCGYVVADCGCDLGGGDYGVAGDFSNICGGGCDVGGGADKYDNDPVDNGIDGENDAWLSVLVVHAFFKKM